MASITALGGAAPPVATSTVRANVRFTSAGACTSMLSTIGAPHRWVTPACSISGKITAGSTLRRQTWVPPTAVTAQV